MDYEEKVQRCKDAEYVQVSETCIRCRVYSRWVSDCPDGSFSSISRPGLGRG